jgi:outer membrane protein OmpA-like peptidoglycan-associated protein
VFALVAICVGAPAPAAVSAAPEDHPLVSGYEGSILKSKKVEEFGEYMLVTGRTLKGDLVGEALKGKLTRIVYENPKGRSTLEIFANYQKALVRAGMTEIYTCEMAGCGPAFARSAWNRFNGLFAAADGDPRYLAGKIVKGPATVYVAVMVGRARTQLDIVEITAMQDNLVVVDAGALGQGIDREGRVSVYGIHFDTDKADVKPESKPALDEIAKLLRERPTLTLFVVGHTDMTGDRAHNQTLSEARARAIVQALVKDYGIAPARLEGYGVGPLAPVASNGDPAGRTKNRRVELVAR